MRPVLLVVIVSAMLVCLSLPAAALGAPGDLDPAFAENGVALIDLGTSSEWVAYMTVQPDGKVLAVIVAGDPTWEYYVARFTDDGQPDAGFGAGGRVLLHKGYLQAMGSQDVGWHMAIQPYTDRVLVSYDFGIPLTAFDSDGRLDLAFGGDDLDGTVEWPVVYPGEDTRVTRWSVDGDGRLLGVGYVGAQPSDILLVRLTAEGVPDLTFGSAGVVTTGLAARTHDVGHICGQLADGGIFVYAQVQSDMGDAPLPGRWSA